MKNDSQAFILFFLAGVDVPTFEHMSFRQHFIDGLEPEGASLAVYVDDKKVVDLWGGYADFQANRIWKKDTITVAFSTTKAVAAVCIALLADRGRLSYDDLVSKHWPGFAKNGKENITVNWAVSHMAGLYYFETPITKLMVKDHNLIREAIENETPKFTPGERSGYHALTYGYLVDQIIRHTDEKKRGIGQFFREEIAQPNGEFSWFCLNANNDEWDLLNYASAVVLRAYQCARMKTDLAGLFINYTISLSE
ncbi:unnamed protein product [Cylicostephanus goldi]|uniref:Beta-lactamase-related domain-containing protein n=1 Tax=Cylicostephanus goldi TaxID=71465 RepID=A0A3P6RKX8_CYLGO|nr:unnamed protein product [Cylicostephanus goldi]